MFDFIENGWNGVARFMCGVCLLWMLFGAVIAVYRWLWLSRAITTKATITNLIEKKKDDGQTLYAPVFVFTDQQGRLVKVTSWAASFPPPGDVGDKIEVLYDPRYPHKAILNQFFDLWGYAAIMGSGGAFYFVVFAAVTYFTRHHLKEPENELLPTTAAGPSY